MIAVDDCCCTILEHELATHPKPDTIALWKAVPSGTFPVLPDRLPTNSLKTDTSLV
jgi:hypothetical protein